MRALIRMLTLALSMHALTILTASAQRIPNPDPTRFQAEIDQFTAWDAKNTPPKDAVLFVGSSSIRLWNTAAAFAPTVVINRGFGGSQISDVLHYYDRVVAPYAPRALVFYCGDNDIADGKPPEQVLADFTRFLARVRASFGAIPVIWIPAKPSVARWAQRENLEGLNNAVAAMAAKDPTLVVADIWAPMLATGEPPAADLFQADGLHMSDSGYALWTSVVTPVLQQATGDTRR